MIEHMTFGGRTLAILSPVDLEEIGRVVSAPFAAMVPAVGDSDVDDAALLAANLARIGCAEICCVGPRAEVVHDRVDDVVEDVGASSVVTTWHLDSSEGCEYFLFTAAGRPSWLLAAVEGREELTKLLRAMVRAAGGPGTRMPRGRQQNGNENEPKNDT
jgi:hypothetical protein